MNADSKTLIRNLWAIAIVVVAVIAILFVVVLPAMDEAREIRAWCDSAYGPETSNQACRAFYEGTENPIKLP